MRPALIAEALKAAAARPTVIGRVELPPEPDGSRVALSPNRMVAYLIPGSGPTEVRGDALRAELASLGVTHGVRAEVIAGFTPTGAADSIVVLAEGTRPVPPVNARVEHCFANAAAAPVQREDGSVDYHAATTNYSVEEGAVLARRIPPVDGKPGRDVLGEAAAVPVPADHPLAAIAGAGTVVEGDSLLAARAGRPVVNGGEVEVLAVLDIKGDVNYAVGNIKFSGDVIVGGDVKAGFRIEAEGSVTVRGIVDHATIEARRDITVGGILGDGQITIKAGGDLKAQYIHKAAVAVAGTLTVNRELGDCAVTARKVQVASSGRIVGGEVTAREEVIAGAIGSGHNLPTQITVLPFRGGKQPAVVRVSGVTHAGTAIKVGYTTLKVADDIHGASFWEVDGEIMRLGPAATYTEPVKPGAQESAEAA